MSDATTQKNTLRNARQGQQAMPMPKDSGAMLVCKVPAKRPMPCTAILIHGVNDDGQFFPWVDKYLCAGLNKRLGRDDLFPHKWGSWKEGSKAAVPPLDAATVICEEGRSPVIPFHWGYRPVDRTTYRQDQQRYMAQLKANNRNPDLPYSTYYLEKQTATRQNSDNLGNWLNKAYAKDGGPYPNATTNLVDMWGPGVSGGFYGLGKLAQRDPSALMNENPHRIYYVHAARRLADLILRIRSDPIAGPDTINIIAHSQGTEIAMLANFMVMAADQRPIDCLILCHSPYGLDPTQLELGMPGRHQSGESRRATLRNLVKLMQDHKRPVLADRVIAKGVASRAAWEGNPHNARDNFGHVYNYFCPQDTVVALPNIQGIGWQGVDDGMLKTSGSNFYQRVFSDGHRVGAGPEQFSLRKASNLAGQFGILTGDGTRTINAPRLPETYTFRTLANDSQRGDKLGEHLAGTALAIEGLGKVRRLVDKATGTESVVPASLNSSLALFGYEFNPAGVKAHLAVAGYPHADRILAVWQPVKAWVAAKGVGQALSNSILIERTETPDEALSRIGERPVDWSQHSAITLSAQTIEKCMAYDLAIGLTAAFDDEKLWWELIHRADWRSEQNPDADARAYRANGVLPRDIKPQMNKPVLPRGVENKFASLGLYKTQKALNPYGVIDELVDWITMPGGGTGQWPLPKPDVEG